MIGLLKERTNHKCNLQERTNVNSERTDCSKSRERSNAEPNGRESEHIFGRMLGFPEHGVLR